MNKIRGKIVGNSATTPMKVADWNQNDEMKADYIKNRTHYEAKLLIGEGTATGDWGTIALSQPFDWNNAEIFVNGEKVEYEVWDNLEAEDLIQIATDDSVFLQYYSASANPLEITITPWTPAGTQIQIYQSSVKTLDEKYIPDTIARVSDVEKVEVDVEGVKTDVARLDRVVEQMSTSSGTGVKNTATGEAIKLTDSTYAPIEGLVLYGKTTQADTPTPDNPQELESVGESVEVSVYDGKNLFNNDTSLLKKVTFMGSTQQGTRIGYEPLVLPAGTYTFTLKDLGTATDKYIYGVINDKDGNYVAPCTLLADTSNNTPLTVKVNEGDKLYIYDGHSNLSIPHSVKRFNSVEIQLEVGSATPYTPYKASTTYTVNTPNGLKGIPVNSGGNYTDSNGQQWICDEIDYNRGVYIQRIGEYRNTGAPMVCYTASPNAEKDNIYWNELLKGIKLKTGMAKSNYFSFGYGYATIPYIVGVTADTNDSYLYFSIKLSETEYGTTYDKAKEAVNAWIAKTFSADNPLIVYYVLETPIETPLTAEMIEAYTHYPTTTILSDKAGLKVGYVADTKNYIDNKFAELQQAILSTGGNV